MNYNIVKPNRRPVWKELLILARCDFSKPSERTDSGMFVNGFRDSAWASMLHREPVCFVDSARTPRLFAAIQRFKEYNK